MMIHQLPDSSIRFLLHIIMSSSSDQDLDVGLHVDADNFVLGVHGDNKVPLLGLYV